jgi:iron(II)-dependent oxidoreductase
MNSNYFSDFSSPKNKRLKYLFTKKVVFLLGFLLLLTNSVLRAQQLRTPKLDTQSGVRILSFFLKNNSKIKARNKSIPLFSLRINGKLVNTKGAQIVSNGSPLTFKLQDGILVTYKPDKGFNPGWKATITLKNTSQKKVAIENIVPFGQSDQHVYITASGPWSLARTKLYRPGKSPIGVVLPDDAWEMGYCSFPTKKSDMSVVSIARRTGHKNARLGRWKATLKPEGTVTYTMYADTYKGAWQNGIRLMFQKRYLYDLKQFNDSLFLRKDLQWIRHKYIIGLQMAWDHEFYDSGRGGYQLEKYLANGQKLFGGYGVYALWPTWPRLGLDNRNQWDLYRDLPGGLNQLHRLSELAHKHGTKFFIEYNPWDKSTRPENPYKGLASIIKGTDADGVVLDTRAKSNPQLRHAADSVKEGVVMYSEGMAVPKNMPTIVSGRVHDAIHMPPPLNLNKFIKPDFAIFRVCRLNDGYLHREFAVSLFNGYGVEINEMGVGRPTWTKKALHYLGLTSMILRENSDAFLSQNWQPLINSIKDSVWVNKWPGKDKTIYTIYSLRPGGYKGPLFRMNPAKGTHYVDIWNHKELQPDTVKELLYTPVDVHSFNKSWLGTRREGNVDCIAQFPNLLTIKHNIDTLRISANKGTLIKLWAGEPSYQGIYKEFTVGQHILSLRNLFDRYEGKFVVQLFDGKKLLDERVININPGTARLISKVKRTKPVGITPKGMVKIPGASIMDTLKQHPGFVPYPIKPRGPVQVKTFYMDKYPVTNVQYYAFIKATNYTPKDTHNYLRNWTNGHYSKGSAQKPVVWVSMNDAKAYAKWAGKRLPTEMEWQLAAQGTDGRKWPWGAKFDSTKCNVNIGQATDVNQYPSGASPYGVEDLVGNVWQLTNDLYDDGTYYFEMIRGGSYYHPTASWWYIYGGPESLNMHQILLKVSPGFDRSATVGFRCAKDAE